MWVKRLKRHRRLMMKQTSQSLATRARDLMRMQSVRLNMRQRWNRQGRHSKGGRLSMTRLTSSM